MDALTQTRFLLSPHLDGYLRLERADEVLAIVRRILKGWDLTESENPPTGKSCLLDIAPADEGWRISGQTLARPNAFKDSVSAACFLTAETFKARMLTETRYLCLHAAAVEIDGGLVVMPSRYRAGKSLLSAGFAAAGYRVFNDDVLFLDKERLLGVAPGLSTRLRLPLPDGLEGELLAFIDRGAGPRGERYLYLESEDDIFAAPGAAAPIKGFVLLERREGTRATLGEVEPGVLLRQLIWQNFARAGSALDILRTLCAQVEQADCLQLTYSDLAEARDLLIQHFGGESSPKPLAGRVVLDSDASFAAFAQRRLDAPANASLVREAGAELHFRAGQAFLTGSSDDRILHLNEMALALWNLLADRPVYGQVLDIFQMAFPDTERDKLDGDLQGLLSALKAHDLIRVEAGVAASPGTVLSSEL